MIGFVLVIAIAVGGYRYYKTWEARRLVKRAEVYLGWGDARSAALTAQRAFQLDGSNSAACRVLAQIAEREGLGSAAIEWRQRVLSIVPNSVADRIELARTAVAFEQIEIAEAALNRVKPGAENLPRYHEVAGHIALAKQDIRTAEKQFAEAARLDPSNQSDRLNLAVLQLQSSSAEVRDQAHAVLEKLLNDKSLRVRAARALRDYASRRANASELLQVSEVLNGFPEATFQDRISYVQVLQVLGRPDFPGKLAELQNEATNDPGKLSALISWMANNHLAVFAIAWVKQLPNEIISNKAIRLAIADCYVTANDPAGLTQWCGKADWGNLEYLRRAYLGWAARVRGDDLTFQSEWNNALRAAGSKGQELFTLEQTAARWRWKEETENLLWQLTRDPDKQKAALTVLNQVYLEQGDTAQLYRVVSRLAEIRPDDPQVQNNLASLALLLNVDTEMANAIAERLYKSDPKNAVFASTYGFALYRRGKYQQAVAVMNQLNPSDLEQPAVAAYYAVFQLALGNKAKAAEYLGRSSGANLLPQEKALVEQARKAVGQQK